MAGNSLRLSCGPRTCALLCEAIRGYAAAAFPAGGSECAQASRESLLTLAERFTAEQARDGVIELRTRQRALLRSAVSGYFEQVVEAPEALAAQRRDRLLAWLRGEAVPDESLDPPG